LATEVSCYLEVIIVSPSINAIIITVVVVVAIVVAMATINLILIIL
jgi:hypothetical protein